MDLDLIFDLVFGTLELVTTFPYRKSSDNKPNSEDQRTDHQLVLDRYCVTRRILDPHYVPKFSENVEEKKVQEYLNYLDQLIDFAKKANEAIPDEKYFDDLTYRQYFKKLNQLKQKFIKNKVKLSTSSRKEVS